MKVLVVEDDAALLVYVKDTLEAEGHETRTAENGRQGFKLYHEFKPDMVISDIQMPEISGLELLKAIRRTQSETIMILMTAYGSEEYAMQALRLGADNYLKKPVRHADLLPLLRKYDTLVKNRTIRRQVFGMIVRKEFTMLFDTNIEQLPRIVDHLVLETGNIFSERERLSIRLGLFELLANAVEHGNLGITRAEKRNALQAGTLTELYTERLAVSELAARKITVKCLLEPQNCEWVISDEGKGFDWQTVIRSQQKTSDSLAEHSRGILVAQYQFDDCKYLGTGNSVRVRKLARHNEKQHDEKPHDEQWYEFEIQPVNIDSS